MQIRLKLTWATVHAACADLLQSLLGLLTTQELIGCVKELLVKDDVEVRRTWLASHSATHASQLHQKSLLALKARVEKDKRSDVSARTAVLDFVPQITDVMQSSSSTAVKRSALACVDSILDKYGRKEPETVAAAAKIIVGASGLGHTDARLHLLALFCLVSCVEVLGAGIIPILPQAFPKALEYLGSSVHEDGEEGKVQTAVFSFVEALLDHVPWMITGSFLDKLLRLLQQAAEGDCAAEVGESRRQLFQSMAKQMDAKECFAAVERNWSHAVQAGPDVRLKLISAPLARQLTRPRPRSSTSSS